MRISIPRGLIYASIFVIVMAAVSLAMAQHIHYWQKVSQIAGENGQVVCDWKCATEYPAHYTTTSGYGSCPMPL